MSLESESGGIKGACWIIQILEVHYSYEGHSYLFKRVSNSCYSFSGASSLMVARGALWNASIFSPLGQLPWEDVKREYIRKVCLSSRRILVCLNV